MKHKYTDEEIQAAIDAACNTTTNPGYTNLDIRTTCQGWQREAPARLDLIKSALAALPDPELSTVDGKTPGEFYNELARSEESNRFMKWSDFTEEDRASENKRLYAVIDAFSGAGLEQAIAMMEAVPLEELSRIWRVNSQTHHEDLKAVRARLIAAAREGQPAVEALKDTYQFDGLPDPKTFTAHGKTPGRVAWDAGNEVQKRKFPNQPVMSWQEGEELHEQLETAASAVLAAFAEAKAPAVEADPYAELKAAHAEGKVIQWHNGHMWHDLSYSEHPLWIHPAKDYRIKPIPATVDWKSRHDELQKAYAGHADVTAALHDKVQKAEAELALMTLDYDKCRKERGELLNQRDQLLARPQLSTLRPIAEAGEVPAGCVRLTGARNDDGTWELAEAPATSFDTHCADFYLPDEAKTPAAETFEAHGKTWNSHTPRTDAVVKGEWLQYEKLARQLERELNAAKSVLTQIYNDTEGYADGAPDASSHDKLCNEISSICKSFVTTP